MRDWLHVFDRRCRLRCRRAKEGRERLHLVAGLDLLDVVDVVGCEELGTEEGECQVRFGGNHFREQTETGRQRDGDLF